MSDYGFPDSGFKLSGPVLGFPIQDSSFGVQSWGFRFRIQVVRSSCWFSIQDSSFGVQSWVFRFRVQVFGANLLLSDSGFKVWGPVLGFSIQA